MDGSATKETQVDLLVFLTLENQEIAPRSNTSGHSVSKLTGSAR